MDCQREQMYQRPTTAPRLCLAPTHWGSGAATAGGSRSCGCSDEVFLLQPPGLAQGKQAPLCPSKDALSTTLPISSQ